MYRFIASTSDLLEPSLQHILKEGEKAIVIKFLLISDHSYYETRQTIVCLPILCYRRHSHSCLLALTI
jgi:hypothetical protein